MHKIKTISQKMIDLSKDADEVKLIADKVTEQEFRLIQIKKICSKLRK